MQIDTTTPWLEFFTTGRSVPWVQDSMETRRKTTRKFIYESQATANPVIAAINAGPWTPWPDTWNAENLANLSGLSVSNGTLVSPGTGAPSFVFGKNEVASMAATHVGTDTSSIEAAVSGFSFVLTNGAPTIGDTSLHPRTGIGLSQNSRHVYFMTIDGRQTASEGATTDDVGSWLKYFGSYTGINMDGGGSTTMAWWNPNRSGTDKSELINFPVGIGSSINFFPTERTNGNNIGVYYTTVPDEHAWADTDATGLWSTSTNWQPAANPSADWDVVVMNTSLPSGQTAIVDSNSTAYQIEVSGVVGPMELHVPTGAVLTATAGLSIQAGGILAGSGTVIAHVVNDAMLSVGNAASGAAGMAVPEPSGLLLLLLGLGVWPRDRRSKRSSFR